MNNTITTKEVETRKHISFSELKKWNACPYSRKLAYGDRIKLFTGNSYTAFGEAVHETLESLFSNLVEDDKAASLFEEKLIEKLNNCSERIDKVEKDMPSQGSKILKDFRNHFIDYFGKDFSVFSLEEEVYEPSGFEGYNFKGFIDMVIKDSSGVYHIIDWKTCSWGWDLKKRTDPMVVYQLIYYKNFFAKKHNIPRENIKIHFGLLKRTAKDKNVEFFSTTSGSKRINNALALLEKAVLNIKNGPAVKNRLSCKYCEFYKTEHCS